MFQWKVRKAHVFLHPHVLHVFTVYTCNRVFKCLGARFQKWRKRKRRMKKIQRKRRVQPPAQRKPVLQPVLHGSTFVSPMCARRYSTSFNVIVTARRPNSYPFRCLRSMLILFSHAYQRPCSVSRALASAEQEGERERERERIIVYSVMWIYIIKHTSTNQCVLHEFD